jgi:hypothetical protein
MEEPIENKSESKEPVEAEGGEREAGAAIPQEQAAEEAIVPEEPTVCKRVSFYDDVYIGFEKQCATASWMHEITPEEITLWQAHVRGDFTPGIPLPVSFARVWRRWPSAGVTFHVAADAPVMERLEARIFALRFFLAHLLKPRYIKTCMAQENPERREKDLNFLAQMVQFAYNLLRPGASNADPIHHADNTHASNTIGHELTRTYLHSQELAVLCKRSISPGISPGTYDTAVFQNALDILIFELLSRNHPFVASETPFKISPWHIHDDLLTPPHAVIACANQIQFHGGWRGTEEFWQVNYTFAYNFEQDDNRLPYVPFYNEIIAHAHLKQLQPLLFNVFMAIHGEIKDTLMDQMRVRQCASRLYDIKGYIAEAETLRLTADQARRRRERYNGQKEAVANNWFQYALQGVYAFLDRVYKDVVDAVVDRTPGEMTVFLDRFLAACGANLILDLHRKEDGACWQRSAEDDVFHVILTLLIECLYGVSLHLYNTTTRAEFADRNVILL